MTGMIERVAAAIWDSHEIGDFDSAPSIERGFHLKAARAAIEAMLEPDDAMKLAGGFKCEAIMFEGDDDGTGVIFNDMGHVYREMIKAALDETRP